MAAAAFTRCESVVYPQAPRVVAMWLSTLGPQPAVGTCPVNELAIACLASLRNSPAGNPTRRSARGQALDDAS